MADIFISYAHEDEARIKPLAQALEQRNWSVFWDQRIPAGQTWRSHIGQALSDARCVIVAWSRHSINSKCVTEEADEGQKHGILVPLLLDSVEPPIGFRSIQAGNLVDWQPGHPSSKFDRLVQDIEVVLGTTSQPPHTIEPFEKGTERPIDHMPPRREKKFFSRRFIYAFMIILLAGIVLGYWGYQQRPDQTPGLDETLPNPSEPDHERITIYPDIRDMGKVGGGGVSGSLTKNNSQPFSPPSFGDSGRGRETRGFLSFDLSQIGKGRTIHSAKFYAAMGGRSGDLDNRYFRTVVVEEIIIEGSIDQREFDDPGLSVSTVPLSQFRSKAMDVTNAIKRAYRNGQQHATLRFRFSVGHDNDDESDGWAFSYSRAQTKLVIEVADKE